MDGREVAALSSVYPKPSPPPTSYHFGNDPFDDEADEELPVPRWSMASCQVFALALHADLVLLMHRLGPRYYGNFQDGSLFRFLTYQMYTSISVHLFRLHKTTGPDSKDSGVATITGALGGDVGFNENQIILSLNPGGLMDDPEQPELSGVKLVRNTGQWDTTDTFASVVGDVVVSRAQALDDALWRVGGPAIALELVHFSSVSSVSSRQVPAHPSVRARQTSIY